MYPFIAIDIKSDKLCKNEFAVSNSIMSRSRANSSYTRLPIDAAAVICGVPARIFLRAVAFAMALLAISMTGQTIGRGLSCTETGCRPLYAFIASLLISCTWDIMRLTYML